nr:transporter substrate-binding domain-containing protein [Desulfobulbaceae bacterium]
MRKIICHFFSLIALLVSFYQPSPVWADEAITRPLRVGIFANKPMCYINEQGEPAGIFVETIQYIAEQEEWSLEFIEGSWSDQRQRLEKGDLDILMAMAFTEELKKIYTFNGVDVFNNWAEIYVRPKSRISSFLDLQGKRVASLDKGIYITGPEGILSLNERFQLDAQIIPVDSYEAAMAAVRDGRAEAAVSNRMTGTQYADKYGLIKSGIVFYPVSIRFSLNQESPLTPLLVAAIDKHLKDLRADPHSVYHRAIAAALGGGAKEFWPPWVIYTTLVLAILITGMLSFLFVLRLQVKKKTKELSALNSRLAAKMATQEKTARALKESEERFRSLADSMFQLVWTADPNGRVDYANARMQQAITGLHGIKEMIHPDDFNQTGRSWARAVATGQPYRMEHRLAHSDNTYHWYLTLGVPALNQEGQVRKWYGTSTDIHELRLAQESLREKRDLLDEVQELTLLGGWNLDVDSGVMAWTKGTYRIHDVSPDQ